MRFISELREGGRIQDVYLCKYRQSAVTKNGKNYETVILQDRTGQIEAKIWDPTSDAIGEFDALDYIYVAGTVSMFNGSLQASLKHYVDGTTEVGWVDVEHTMRAKDTPRPVVFRDSALKAQIASVLGWETFDADRMFETLSGISVNMDMVTLHFKDGGAKQFRYIQPKQIHRKRKETT